jgi:hypothetical protein
MKDGTDVGVLYIGQVEDQSGFFTRTLRLQFDPEGKCFEPFPKGSDASKLAPRPAPKGERPETATS